MNETESEPGTPKSEKKLPIASGDEIQITKADFSKLTHRQRFVVTEYEYLLSPEDAEEVGKMLGNFAQEKDILYFCQAKGKKVISKEQNKIVKSSSPQTQAMIFGMYGAFIGAIPVSILKLLILFNDNLRPLCTWLTDDSYSIILTTCGILVAPSGGLCFIYFAFNLLGGALFGILGARIRQGFSSHIQKEQKRAYSWSFTFGLLFDLLFVFYWLWPGY